MTLQELKPGWSGIVTMVEGLAPSRRRLIDLGILPGVWITVLQVAPFGDPYLVQLRGYSLSLRKEDMKRIRIEGVQKNECCIGGKSKLRKNNLVQPTDRKQPACR